MRYLGSKESYAKEILTITQAQQKSDQVYVEPMVGGGNIICRAIGPRIGNDLNWRIVAMLDALGNKGWVPPAKMTEKEYLKIKDSPDSFDPELVALAATGLSFGGVWISAFAKDKQGKRNYCQESYNNALDMIQGLRGVKFYSMRYEEFTPLIPPESIVYCDPPYAGTTGYGGAKTDVNIGESLSLNTWNRSAFWRWADNLVLAGHKVFVSEYNGPPPAIYQESSDLKAEKAEWAARFKKLQTDQKSKREDREQAARVIKDVEARIKQDRERIAAKWQVMWEKEVISSFDSGRGEEGKREVEKLFHRAP